MEIHSARQWSMVGLLIVIASAVTATVVPAKKKLVSRQFAVNGSLTYDPDGDEITCRLSVNRQTCHDSITCISSGSTNAFGCPTLSDATTLNDPD